MNDKIDIELAEDEDMARAKAWWKENGSSIIAGIVIGTIIVVGYNYWKTYKENHALQIAQLYEDYTATPDDQGALDKLVQADTSAVYSQLARMNAAKQAHDAQEFDQAEKLLGEVMSATDDQGLRAVAALRLALVYLAQDKPAEAIGLLDKQTGLALPLMQARVAELKADAYLKQGDSQTAQELYQSSIDLLGEAGQPANLVQLKLDNL